MFDSPILFAIPAVFFGFWFLAWVIRSTEQLKAQKRTNQLLESIINQPPTD